MILGMTGKTGIGMIGDGEGADKQGPGSGRDKEQASWTMALASWDSNRNRGGAAIRQGRQAREQGGAGVTGVASAGAKPSNHCRPRLVPIS